jgi:adenylate cyclase
VIIGQLTPLLNLELNLLDYRFKIRGTQSVVKSPIVILAIDDQSDESTPARWPWPRSYYAHVIENLNEAGVKAIGIDVIFDQADQNGAQSDSLLVALDKYKNVVLAGKIDILRPLHRYGHTGSSMKFSSERSTVGPGLLRPDQDGFYRRYLVDKIIMTAYILLCHTITQNI